MIEPSVYDPNGRTEAITFPVEGPDFGIDREDLSAVKHVEYVRLVQAYWVQAGRPHGDTSPGLHHNVSCTISVRPDEWTAVADFGWAHRQAFTGIAMLQDCGDKVYQQAPREGVVTAADLAKWNALSDRSVDDTALEESEDITDLKLVVACAGGGARGLEAGAGRGRVSLAKRAPITTVRSRMKKLVTLLSSLCLAVAVYAGSGKVPAISHADLQAAIAKQAVTVLDVNGSDSFAEGRIPGAIDFTASEKKLAALLPKDKTALIVAYCGNEQCSAYQAAASAAVALGYTNVKHYAPGIDGWTKSGAKVEKS